MKKFMPVWGLIFVWCFFENSFSASQNVSLVNAFPTLNFRNPVFLTHSNDGTNRIFIVEQQGIIRVFANDSGATNAAVFLDITDRVNDSASEMGLLGLAFHPNFAQNRFFYVNYTTGGNLDRRTMISRFSVDSGDPNLADPNSEFILLEIPQPFSNHNGGMIQFGPDGFLYIATGDGGSGGDPLNSGQNRTTLLGNILRIDVDNPSGNLNYGIPANNPFVGNGQNFREEIFAFGLRNPWRFSIDLETGEIWAGDVGQSSREEVDLIENGNNYGWRVMEGNLCFDPPSGCNMTGLTLPVKDYGRSLGISITGGFIYRGSLQPALVGAYIYGDFGSGRIWMLRLENGQLTADSLLINTNLSISSFGIDDQNELYIVNYGGGIFRFNEDPTTTVSNPSNQIPSEFTLKQNFPNPFNPTTTIAYSLKSQTRVELTIHNIIGQKIITIVNVNQSPGEYKIVWNGHDEMNQSVASGVYLYELKTEKAKQTRKMLLLR